MKNYLLISLGHNSSAAFVRADGSVIAYEQERIDGIKSSSQFPYGAIWNIIKHVGMDELKDCAICISHWFDFKSGYRNKYFTQSNMMFLRSFSDDIRFVNKDFTHHDAHAFSVYSFYNYHIKPEHKAIISDKPVYTIVADGFGNNGEVISVYKSMPCSKGYNSITAPELIHRVYGYESSLGLMYQYATGFTKMKENQDEYKFLGYESHIDEYFSQAEIERVISIVNQTIVDLTDNIFGKIQFKYESTDEVIDISKLDKCRQKWYDLFTRVCTIAELHDQSTFESRTLIGFFIQKVIEGTIRNIIARFNMENVLVAGGIFYNVKLNNSILKSIPGIFCVMPLAGDQGAAFGMREHDLLIEDITRTDFSTLCWGKRDLYAISKVIKGLPRAQVREVNYHETEFEALSYHRIGTEIADLICDGKIVNLVRGNMEFGPRALCNTSTLFLPYSTLTEENNKNNNRNEVMPCAPVMLEKDAFEFFDKNELPRIVGSNQFMICTMEYIYADGAMRRYYDGVMHKIPMTQKYTGRPQIIVSDKLMTIILRRVQEISGHFAIVNTSFNAHGRPIAFDTIQVVENYKYQLEHSGNNKPYLFIVDEKGK